MKLITLKVSAAHIAGVTAAGYGPKIIMAAFRDRLVPGVHVQINNCWVMFAYRGQRWHIHLPLDVLPYTHLMGRTPLLRPIIIRIGLPAVILLPRARRARKRPA